MKVMLVLEHHFYKDDRGDYWCDRVVNYEYLKRYLSAFEELYVLARVAKLEEDNSHFLKASGNNVHFLELPNYYGTKGTLLHYRGIQNIIKKQCDMDCVIMRMPSSLGVICYSAIKKLHKPIAVEFVMAADKLFESNNWLNTTINKYIDNYVKKICMEVQGVSYVTEHILQDKYPCSALCGNGGFTGSYSSIDLVDEFFYEQDWKYDNKPSEYLIIHTGYMDDLRKGQDILIMAVAELIHQGMNVKLELIGDGEYRGRFEKLADEQGIKDKVVFDGLLTEKKDIVEKLKFANLFVMPTHSEGLPRCIIEAMAVGLPCIASDVDGIPELLDNECMIHEFDYHQYADVIGALLNDWERMVKISKENYNTAKKYKKSVLDNRRKHFYLELKNSVHTQ